MLRNLKAEMVRKSLKPEEIANTLGINEKTVRNKIAGVTPVTFPESLKIRDSFFPELNIEYLFAESSEAEESA